MWQFNELRCASTWLLNKGWFSSRLLLYVCSTRSVEWWDAVWHCRLGMPAIPSRSPPYPNFVPPPPPTAAREMRRQLSCSRSLTLCLGIINISFPPSSSHCSLTWVFLMLDLRREFEWVRKPEAVCITWTYTESLIHMSMGCVFFSDLYGLCSYFCKAPFFFNLGFPKKDLLKFYDWISNTVARRLIFTNLPKGKANNVYPTSV